MQRGLEVVVLELEALDPAGLIGAGESVPGRQREAEEVMRVARVDGRALGSVPQLGGRVLADRGQ